MRYDLVSNLIVFKGQGSITVIEIDNFCVPAQSEEGAGAYHGAAGVTQREATPHQIIRTREH